ncbi:MAG: PKD domain-containing protein [Candidatus Thermoplasmatota archaeon]|nr:PKD domain-containing protein [Candidatus Thermoplasmatota archaeon]
MHVKKCKKASFAVVLTSILILTFFLSPSLATDGNTPPSVDFHWEPIDDLKTNQEINFYDDSVDEDGEIIAWEWSFGDETYAIIQNPTHAYSNDGIYTVTLTVIDNNGSTNSTSKHITIHNRPPVADAGPDQVVNNTLVSFDGTGSNDPDGTIVTYKWYFGDGGSATGAVVTHNYSQDGIYTATLNVTDNDGAKDEDTCQITIDTVAPKTNISIGGTKGDDGWYISNVTITLLPSDATSGVDKTYYLLNNGTWKTYTTQFVISNEGKNILKYYSIDEAGNVEAVNIITIKIDKTSPTITITTPTKGYIHFFGRSIMPTLGNKTIIIGRITVEANVTDTHSGIKDVKFYIDDHMKYNTSEPPYTWRWGMAFGRHNLKIKVFDNAGHNASDEVDVTIFSILPGRNDNVYTQDDVPSDLKFS